MPLRPHQLTGVQFLLDHNRRAILADSAGMGKSVCVLDALFTPPHQFPVLIVGNRPGLAVWENELHKWYSEPSCIYAGTPKQRGEKLQDFITNSELNFLVTTYGLYPEVLAKTSPQFFRTLVMDEYHLFGLLNRKTKLYKFTKSIAKLIDHLILLTGTPMRQSPSDWYTALSLIAPSEFTSFWRFVEDYCIITKDQFGITIERMPQNEKVFLEMLSRYRRRCTDKSHLPPKTRQPIVVEMTKKQGRLYDSLRQEMYLEEDGQFIITPNKLTNVLRCRQLMVSPRLLGFDDNGGALNMVKDLVEEELSEGNPVVVFTPFRKAVVLIREELEKIKGIAIYIVQGGMNFDEHKKVQEEFQSNPSKNKVVICTIKSGTAMTLTAASVSIFLGYELGVHDNTQSEDRLARESQKNPVRIYYLLYRDNAVDARGVEILNDKNAALAIDVSVNDYYKDLVDKPTEKC